MLKKLISAKKGEGMNMNPIRRPDYLSLSVTRPNQINFVIEVNLWDRHVFVGGGYTLLSLPKGSSISLSLGWILDDPLPTDSRTREEWINEEFLRGFSQNASYGLGDKFKYISAGKTIVEPNDGRKQWLTADEYGFGSHGLDVGGTYSIDIRALIDSIRQSLDVMTVFNEGYLEYMIRDQLERNIIERKLAFSHFC